MRVSLDTSMFVGVDAQSSKAINMMQQYYQTLQETYRMS